MLKVTEQLTQSRFHGGFSKRCFLLLAVLTGGLLYPAAGSAQLSDYLQLPQAVPGRDVIVVGGGGAAWKNEWDEARRLWRAGNYAGAAESYRQLLVAKDSVAAARWELAQVLIRAERWEEARRELELLVESPPARIDYLNALGMVLRLMGQFGRALEVFDKAHALAPDDFSALVGLTQGLVEVGRKKEAFPLFQRIVSQRPDDRDLHLALANLAFELGRLETARKELVPLAVAKNAELDILLMAARVHEGLGREQEAARYWERSLLLAPGNREAQGRLALYYENRGQLDKALAHLLALLEKNPQNTSLLSRICRLYVQTDRFAEALPYFERYVKLKPEGVPDALPPVVNLRTEDEEQVAFFRRLLAISPDDLGVLNHLAAELEAKGNPEGALFMWEHVARVAPERAEVYRALAALLEKMGRDEPLVVALEAWHRLVPDDLAVVGRLARLQAARGALDSSLAYYDKLERGGYLAPDLFIGRSALYLEKGQPAGALSDLLKLLELSPWQRDIRRKCLALAGELGDERLLTRLAQELEGTAPPGERGRDLLLLAESYGLAGDFSRAARYFQRVLANADRQGEPDSPGETLLIRQARLGLAGLYRQAGLVDEAEQVLREGFLAGDARPLFLEGLFDLSLASQPPDMANARLWWARYQQEPGGVSSEVAFGHARLLLAAGEYGQAEKTIRRLLHETAADGGRLGVKQVGGLGRRAGLSLVGILVSAGQLAEAEKQCLAMLDVNLDQEIMVLLQKIYQLSGEHAAANKISRQLVQADSDSIRLLRLAELYGRQGLAASQAEAAARALEKTPDSLRAGMLLAKGLRGTGELSQALERTIVLADKFPDCTAVNVLLAQLCYAAGEYQAAERQCALVLEKEPGRLDINFLKLRCQLAREDRAAAAELVRQVHPLGVGEVFRKELLAAGLSLPINSVRKSLWQRLAFLEVAPDPLGESLAAENLLAGPGQDGYQLQLLANSFLSRYRWEKRFRAAIRED